MNMQTAIIDSSNWVSYFINKNKASYLKGRIDDFLTGGYKIFVPEMIYVETRNVLARFGFSAEEINETTLLFEQSEFFKKFHGDEFFWFQHVDHIRELVKLRTQDLIILAHAVALEVDEFYTGDKKLQEAYNFVIQHYENLEKEKNDETGNSTS